MFPLTCNKQTLGSVVRSPFPECPESHSVFFGIILGISIWVQMNSKYEYSIAVEGFHVAQLDALSKLGQYMERWLGIFHRTALYDAYKPTPLFKTRTVHIRNLALDFTESYFVFY